MKALILAAGDMRLHSRLQHFRPGLVICADGGLRHAATLGVTPDLLVGDLDSVSSRTLADWPDVPVEKHPSAKGSTDLELATAAAIARGASTLLLVGTSGSRRDQELAALMHAVSLRRSGVRVQLDDGLTRAWPLIAGESLDLGLAANSTFSVVALSDDCRISIGGAAWALAHDVLPFGSGLGISNLATDGPGPTVTLHSGLAVVFAVGA